MAESTPVDDLFEYAMAVLAEGPLPLGALVERLDQAGRLDGLRADGLDEEELPRAVEEEILVTDAVWSSSTDVIALFSHLTEGLVLTHRLTADEVANGEVALTPDLVVLDWDDGDGLELADGSLLVHQPGVHIPGEDHAVLVGPDGWLGGFAPGDLVAFVRTGRSVRVEPAGAPGDDQREVELLRGAVDGWIEPDGCEEAVPIVLDALTSDPTAFRRPVRPLGELLQSAGLEQRGFSFGRTGEDWTSAGEEHYQRELARVYDSWDFNPCCRDAFDQAYEALTRTEHGQDIDARAVAAHLSHGAVAPALAECCLGQDREDPLFELAAVVLAGSPRHTAGARLLVAEVADYRGDALGAEAALRQALRDDPTYGPAASDLARYELDRGDLARAITLLRHDDLDPDNPILAFLEDFRHRFDAPFVGVGRNERCPCGSGRKFKVCCAQDRVPPLSARTELVMPKLSLFAHRQSQRPRLIGIASSACDLDDPDLLSSLAELVRDPLVIDFAIWEGGVAEDYLAQRGELLPADERQLIEELIEEPRRLWEVMAVDPGTEIALRDTATGDHLTVTEHLGSMERQAGELLVARVARLEDQNQLVGTPMTIPLRLRESALRLIDSAPDADQLATWYGQAIAFPTVVNSDRDPLVLCHAEVRTAMALPALHAVLDPVLDRMDEGEWCEHGSSDLADGTDRDEDWDDDEDWLDEGILQGTVAFEGDRLDVEANSVARMERLLATITTAIPDAEVVVDERTDLRRLLPSRTRSAASDGEDSGDLRSAEGPDQPPSAEAEAVLERFMRRKELEWVDESIPALGGLTPRQALDDPTRREDLLALLGELDRSPDMGDGGQGFDADRIRSLLGLDP
ncbi:MAG TPA: SEC-C metal-binding domain-containing protein [Acidimicrobiales bacterium]|nr:SEC-C metal-binding domain-containing protein [Acidimicrobiales bacterium]